MNATFDSTDGNAESGSRLMCTRGAQRFDAADRQDFGKGVKLVDVSWLVGNLYLDEAEKERLAASRGRDWHK